VTNNCRLISRVFLSCCGGVAWPQATVCAPAWAPRSRNGLGTGLGTAITYVRPKGSLPPGYRWQKS
jgi:predicted MFS family arabinose efflux permease